MSTSTTTLRITSGKNGYSVRLYYPCGGTAYVSPRLSSQAQLLQALMALFRGEIGDDETTREIAEWFQAWPVTSAHAAEFLAAGKAKLES